MSLSVGGKTRVLIFVSFSLGGSYRRAESIKNEPPASSGSQQGPTLSPLSQSLTQSEPANNGGCREDGKAKVHGSSGQTENLHRHCSGLQQSEQWSQCQGTISALSSDLGVDIENVWVCGGWCEENLETVPWSRDLVTPRLDWTAGLRWSIG